MKSENQQKLYREYVLNSENKYAVVALLILFVPMLAIFVGVSIGTRSLLLVLLSLILSTILVFLLARAYMVANRKIRVEGSRISIKSGRETVLSDMDLCQFQYVYLLDIKWLYIGKHRIGDSWNKENWDNISYCVFSSAELDDYAIEELSLLLRKKRPNGEIKVGFAFEQKREYFKVLFNARSDSAVVFEQTIILSSS